MIVSRMQVRWLTCVTVRPAWRRASARVSPMLTPLPPLRFVLLRAARGCGDSYRPIRRDPSVRDRSPSVDIRRLTGEDPACFKRHYESVTSIPRLRFGYDRGSPRTCSGRALVAARNGGNWDESGGPEQRRRTARETARQ